MATVCQTRALRFCADGGFPSKPLFLKPLPSKTGCPAPPRTALGSYFAPFMATFGDEATGWWKGEEMSHVPPSVVHEDRNPCTQPLVIEIPGRRIPASTPKCYRRLYSILGFNGEAPGNRRFVSRQAICRSTSIVSSTPFRLKCSTVSATAFCQSRPCEIDLRVPARTGLRFP